MSWYKYQVSQNHVTDLSGLHIAIVLTRIPELKAKFIHSQLSLLFLGKPSTVESIWEVPQNIFCTTLHCHWVENQSFAFFSVLLLEGFYMQLCIRCQRPLQRGIQFKSQEAQKLLICHPFIPPRNSKSKHILWDKIHLFTLGFLVQGPCGGEGDSTGD